MFDFPNNPINGQTTTGPNGMQYVWDGTKWKTVTTTTGGAPLFSPVFQGDPTGPTPATTDNDLSLATTAFVHNAIAANAFGDAPNDGNMYGRQSAAWQIIPAALTSNTGRNFVHNGAFMIQQRGATFNGLTALQANYTADRWLHYQATIGDALSVTLSPANDALRSAIGNEYVETYMNMVFTGYVGANGAVSTIYRIERMRRLSNKQITVSFWAACAGSTLPIVVQVNQRFGTGGSPSAPVAGPTQALTLTTAWARYICTFTVPSAAGKVVGTNFDDCTEIMFQLSGSSAPQQSGNVSIWGMQVELGPTATPFDLPDLEPMLALCQRFYQIGNLSYWGWSGAASITVATSYSFPVAMRAPPFMSSNFSTNSGGVVSTPTVSSLSNSAYQVTGLTIGAGAFGLVANWAASADL